VATKLKPLMILGILIFGIVTLYSVDQNRRRHEKISLMTFGTFHALAQKLYLDDERFSRAMEDGKVVTITKQDMQNKSSKVALIFMDHLGSDSPVQSLSFFMIKTDICFICKTAHNESIYMPDGNPTAIP
jgi:hypothetical protein